jgi:hypothetical protein
LRQAAREPVSGKLPNAPALAVPANVSPSIVAEHLIVIGIGDEIFIDQVTASPSIVPSSHVIETPSALRLVPVQRVPSTATVITDFMSPSGDFTEQSQLPAKLDILTFLYTPTVRRLRGDERTRVARGAQACSTE